MADPVNASPQMQRATGDPAENAGQDHKWLDDKHMAEVLGISPQHLGNLARNGLVPHVRLGRRRVYCVDAVREFMHKQAMGNLRMAHSPTGGEG